MSLVESSEKDIKETSFLIMRLDIHSALNISNMEIKKNKNAEPIDNVRISAELSKSNVLA